MASSRIYLSGAAKRKQRQIRNQNEAKSRRTLEVLNWYTKIQRNNKSCCHVNVILQEKLTMMTLLNRLHSNARAKHPYNLLILNSLVKILSNYFVRRYCIIDKNVSRVCPNGKGPPS